MSIEKIKEILNNFLAENLSDRPTSEVVSEFANQLSTLIEQAYERGKAMKPEPDGVYQNGFRDGQGQARKEERQKMVELFAKLHFIQSRGGWTQVEMPDTEWEALLKEGEGK